MIETVVSIHFATPKDADGHRPTLCISPQMPFTLWWSAHMSDLCTQGKWNSNWSRASLNEGIKSGRANPKVILSNISGQGCPNPVRQCHNRDISEQTRNKISLPNGPDRHNIVMGRIKPQVYLGNPSEGNRQHPCILCKLKCCKTVSKPTDLLDHSNLGDARGRLICIKDQHESPKRFF